MQRIIPGFRRNESKGPAGDQPSTALSMDKGHKMEARGFLVRDSNGDRINVVTLEMIGPGCGE
jgi:hypothetical protein